MKALVLCGLVVTLASGLAAATEYPTRAEETDYRETAGYDETIAYLHGLERASRHVRLVQFGTTPLGRPMYCAVLSSDRAFKPMDARRTEKLVVLVQNGIHSGEIAGKDACLALIRDIAVTGEKASLLDQVILLIIPVFNIDGHEMMSPYNRINQNGPSEMGFRATSQNLNLNRDYLKVDAPEMRSLVELWNDWNPDLLIDNHVTNGADFQYVVTYTITQYANGPASVTAWSRDTFVPVVRAKMSAMDEPIVPYVITRGKPVDSGMIAWAESPRFSTGYAAARNRPGLLVELHMHKDYGRRVSANYKLMVAVLEMLNENPAALKSAVALADSVAIAGAVKAIPLGFRREEPPDTIDFLGYKSEYRQSDISGGDWVYYDRSQPVNLRVPFQNRLVPDETVAPPYAYLIPPQWTDVVERLKVHGVKVQRLVEPAKLSVETYRFSSVDWQDESFEGHHLVRFDSEPFTRTVTYPKGTVIIKTAQAGVRLIVQALEPGGSDSFVRWGFFDTILEQKEYADRHAAEALAVQMLAENPRLKVEFEEKLAADSAFAASPRARWDFFYKRSPYAEPMLNVYPVGRLLEPLDLSLTSD